ncbi:MAG: ASKHA domain-containing protein, partial [Oscillospiraceae bacterium]|nr:ASKHA domain-containing protein [Oscillospiraceae bacterium]
MFYISRVVFVDINDPGNTSEYRFEKAVRVYDALRSAGIVIAAPCGGNHNCGKCFVRVKGKVNAVCEAEGLILAQNPKPRDTENELRLACFCIAEGDCEVFYERAGESGLSEVSNTAVDTKSLRFGVAVDIGTTTLECAIYDKETRERIYYKREMNSQRPFGADVLSRIESSNANGCKPLHDLLFSQVSRLVGSGIAGSLLKADNLEEIAVTGNTTMLHFFDGLDPRGIGVAPFVPKSLFGAVTKTKVSFIASSDPVPIYLAPCIGPYIGGDISCGIVFTRLAEQGRTALLIDVGTNGEIALSKRGEITCCSTAAGPAFEGGEIAMGMVASSGA